LSVKHGLLALLAEAPRHGYQLKTDFEHPTGGSWAINIGQVYTTLQRLERDGLVELAESDVVAVVSGGRHQAPQRAARKCLNSRKSASPIEPETTSYVHSRGTSPSVAQSSSVRTEPGRRRCSLSARTH